MTRLERPISRSESKAQTPPDLGRFDEVSGVGPPTLRWPIPLTDIGGCRLGLESAPLRDSADFSAFASSWSRAMARAVSSSWRSGRWLGGLRFGAGMGGDS